MTPNRTLPTFTLLALLTASPALASCPGLEICIEDIHPSPAPHFDRVDQELRLRKLEVETRFQADTLADEQQRLNRMQETLDAMRRPYSRF